jgi:hypothetical protein
MILCPNCQHKELPGALVCSECGAELVSMEFLNTKTIRKTPSDILPTSSEIPAVSVKNTARANEVNISLHIIDSGQIVHLSQSKEFTLGRMIEGQPILPDIDLSPYDAFTLGVSRLHAALRRVQNDIVISDLGSSNGTRVNGQRIVPHVDYPLNHGDVITLGKLRIQVLINR